VIEVREGKISVCSKRQMLAHLHKNDSQAGWGV
jgi:hypothetical protein